MKKIGDHILYYFDYGVDILNREIYLGSHGDTEGNENGVDYTMASKFIKGLSLLSKHSGDIRIIMNNPGGEWFHGMAIYDAIKTCPHHVIIDVYGQAFSMAGVILQAADYRRMAPNAMFMMHYGSMGMGSTHTKIFKSWSEETEREDQQMEQIFLEKIKEKNPNFTLKRLKSLLNFDTFLSAKETVELGLADEII